MLGLIQYLIVIQPEMDPEVKLYQLPKRHKSSNQLAQGTTQNVMTNYFPITIKPFKKIYIFKIIFQPKIMNDNRVLRQSLLKEAFPSIQTQIKNPIMAGMNIYSVDQPVNPSGLHIAKDYKITIKQVKCIDVNFKQNSKVFLHFLNNGIRNTMSSLNFMEIGKTGKYYKTQSKNVISDGLTLYSGFRVNFLLAVDGLFLRIDPTSKIVQNKTVLQVIDEIYRETHKQRDEKRTLVKEAIIGKIVMTNYGKTRYVKVEDIIFQPLNEVLIPGSENLTILDYYQKKYGIKAREKQPLLQIENKNKRDPNVIYMLPQLCLMTGFPSSNFDERKRREITEKMSRSPTQRYQETTEFVKQILGNSETDTLTNLGIKIDKKPQQLKAKILKAPTLMLGNKQKIQTGKQQFFNLFNEPIYEAKPSEIKIAVLYYGERNLNQMIDQFKQTSKKLSVNHLQFDQIKIDEGSYNRRLIFNRQIFQNKLKASILRGYHLYLIILENNMKDDEYSQVKQVCLKQGAVISQVILRRTAQTNKIGVHTKILLQILAKAGCVLWCPSMSLQLQKIMFVSFDKKKYKRQNKQITNLVGIATKNLQKTKFLSCSVDLEQISDKFQKMVIILLSLLNGYKNRNKQFPEEIIILTDSCPQNQIKMYYDHFIPLFKDKIQAINPHLKLTIIQLRDISSERFFLQTHQRQMMNPRAGIVVSNTIVSENYDFYLVSQKPRIGCAMPLHFNIIYKDSKLQEKYLHELLYSQCFNYANFTGSIKIPAVLQYAKKLARFNSLVLKQENSLKNDVSGTLYFI